MTHTTVVARFTNVDGCVILMSKEHLPTPAVQAHVDPRMSSIEDAAVRSRIRSFIYDAFLLGSGEDLDDKTPLTESGILDSTGVMVLVSYLEDSFHIKIDDREILLDNIESIERLVAFVRRKFS